MKKNIYLTLIILVVVSVSFYSFQNEKAQANSNSVLTAEQDAQIDAYIKKRLKALQKQEYWNCQEKALNEAIPIADSMIAEMYARDLRANDIILERPERPEKPTVEIEPFPFDSIE